VRTDDDPAGLADVARRVRRRLVDLVGAERERWTAVDPDLDAPLDALETAVLSGGKRLRPAFCLWGWVCAGGDLADETTRAAVDDLGAAFELLHAFALIHDDVMDGADTRRGRPTTHVAFGGQHNAAAWKGETRRFGESVAILVGDLAHVYAGAIVATAPSATRVLWREMQVELVVGQYLDVLRTAQGDADAAQARRIARLKSGRYTIEQPLRIGASLVDDPARPFEGSDLDRALVRYGEPCGMAFQLRDDVLGVVGDADRLGKPVGGDLREGKPTPLLAIARDRASAAQRGLLGRVGELGLTDAEIEAMVDVLVDTGALDEVEREIATLTDAAVAAIDTAPVPERARTALVDLARFVSSRQH